MAAALATTGWAGPAAHVQAPPSAFVSAGPLLAGDGVAWAERTGDRTVVKLWRGGTVSAIYAGADHGVRLAASEALVAVQPLTEPSSYGPVRLLVGAPGGRLWPLEFRGCRGRFEVSGAAVAYQSGCREHSSVVTVRRVDPATGAFEDVHSVYLTGDGATFDFDGDWLAWERRDEVVVTNVPAKRDVYTVPVRNPHAIAAPWETSFDVGPDGRLAVVSRAPGERWWGIALFWRGKLVRRLDLAVVGTYGPRPVRLDRGRLLAEHAVTTSPAGRLLASEIVDADLRGRVKPLARYGDARRARPEADVAFSGGRAAWLVTAVRSRARGCPELSCVDREVGEQQIVLVPGPRSRPQVVAHIALDRYQYFEPRETERSVVAGPRLVRGGVAWIERLGHESALRTWLGGSPAVAYWNAETPLAAADRAVAFRLSTAGTPGGRYQELEPDLFGCMSPRAGRIDADGDLVVYTRCRREHNVVLYDVVRRRVVEELAIRRYCCSDLAVAGRYLAWASGLGNVVTVYDRIRRRIAYRAYLGAPDYLAAIDLQRDGTLAVAHAGRIVWFSRAQPRPHEVPIRALQPPRLRLVDDRLLTLERRPAGAALVLLDLRGRRRVVAGFGGRTSTAAEFDFDGRRVTWAEERVNRSEPCETACSYVAGELSIRLTTSPSAPPRDILRVPFEGRRPPS